MLLGSEACGTRVIALRQKKVPVPGAAEPPREPGPEEGLPVRL